MEIARLEGVGHSFRGRPALASLTWSVHEGVTGVIGVNGAGKSTLLRVLATELAPQAGTVEVLGRRGRRLPEARRRIGVMPQDVPLPGAVRVADFLGYVAWLRGVPRRQRADCIAHALGLVQLGERRGSPIGELSGGMRRRLLLAQAVLAEPELLILDEPTAGLDLEQRIRMREIVAGFGWSSAIVISSHLVEDLAPIAQRITMLDGGRKVFDDTLTRLREVGAHPAHGAGPANQLEAAFLHLRNGGGGG